MRRTIITLLFLAALPHTFANKYIAINGIILSGKDSTPVSYVNIGIAEKSIGTISNEAGEFLFNIPIDLINDSIYFSSIGFSNFSVPIKYLNSENNIVFLKPKSYSLNEVIISQENLTALEIITLSKKHFERNLTRTPSLYESYYQEYIKHGNRSTRALDAAVEIYRKNFHRSFQVKIIQIRKKDDLPSGKYYLNGNNLNLALELNDLNKLFQGYKNYRYSVDSIMVYDNSTAYVIKAVPLKNRSSYKTFFIATNDFSLIRADKTTNNTKGNKIKINGNGYVTINRIFTSINFFKYCKEMHPKVMQIIVTTTKLDDKNEKLTTQRKAELITVAIQKESITEIPEKERMNDPDEMFKQQVSFDLNFWKNYNAVPLNPE